MKKNLRVKLALEQDLRFSATTTHSYCRHLQRARMRGATKGSLPLAKKSTKCLKVATKEHHETQTLATLTATLQSTGTSAVATHLSKKSRIRRLVTQQPLTKILFQLIKWSSFSNQVSNAWYIVHPHHCFLSLRLNSWRTRAWCLCV